MITIECDGFLNEEKAEELKEQLTIASKYHTKIILDFEKVTYISSIALGVISSYSNKVDRIEILNVNPKVFAVFDILGITELANVTVSLNQTPPEAI